MASQESMKDIQLYNQMRHRAISTPYEPCFCVGPQNGEPRCRCQMRGIIIRDGRYIEPERDLGPVKS
jgi:hypothetical protein